MLNTYYWLWEHDIDPSFIKYVLDTAPWDKSEQAKVDSADPKVEHDMRKTDLLWYPTASPIACLMHRYIGLANRDAGWNYDLTRYEDVQLARYADGGHYKFHIDTARPNAQNEQRKLTCVLLLNDPSEYEGGLLELKGTADPYPLKKAGSIIVFPSFVEHRVTPVTTGVRYSAVCWANGPAFK